MAFMSWPHTSEVQVQQMEVYLPEEGGKKLEINAICLHHPEMK